MSCLPTVSLAAKVQWTSANVKHGEENEWVYGSTPPEPVIICYNENDKFTYQGDGEITYSFSYPDINGIVPTTPENSGAAQTGWFPVFAGSYSASNNFLVFSMNFICHSLNLLGKYHCP